MGDYTILALYLNECRTTPPTPKPTLASPTPTPQPVTIGATVEADESAYTVNEVLDPAPERQYFGADAGMRLVAVYITQVAIVDDVFADSGRFSVLDADGYVYGDTYARADVAPSFRSADLDAGQKTRGWVEFHVPESTALVSILVRERGSGPSIVIADLTP